MLHDADISVQVCALEAVDTLGSTIPWPDHLQSAGYVRLLVDLIRDHDSMDVKAAALTALCRCIDVGSAGAAEAVRSCNALAVLISLWTPSTGGRVREESARAFSLLTFMAEARPAAVALGVVPPLLKLMQDRAPGVRAAAASVAMSLVVDDSAKEAFLVGGVVNALSKLVADPARFVRLNTLRALCTLCASPDARAVARSLGLVDIVRKLTSVPDRLEADVASKTLAALEFNP